MAVAKHLIESLTSPRAIVLDPMVGSGTTLIAAKQLGRRGIGFDRDPLAVLITRSATQDFQRAPLESLRDRVLERAKCVVRTQRSRLSALRRELPEEDQAFIHYWFSPASQRQLLALAGAIENEPEGPERDLAWVVFSSLIIAKSAGASYAIDISRSRPHKRLDKPVVLPFQAWKQRFDATLSRLAFLDSTSASGECEIRWGDARALPLEDGAVDFVLTSPPYLTAVDYLRSHKFSLVWMGHRIGDLRELRGTMIGTERGLAELDGLPPELEKRLSRQVVPRRAQAQIRRYLSDLGQAIREMARVLRSGGLAVLALGPTIINRRQADAATVVSIMAERHGLQPIANVVRNIQAIRRSLPPPSVVDGENPLRLRMRREVILVLRKRAGKV